MSEAWDELADWWIDEGTGDPSYRFDVVPLLTALLPDVPDGDRGRVLDLGCGDGHLARLLGTDVIGVDGSERLARAATATLPVVVARVPDLACLRSESFDAIVSVYLLDLVDDLDGFFASTAALTGDGGHLVVVVNHPVYTAPGAVPIMDTDGELLWRWGSYFAPGTTVEPAGPGTVRYVHRPMGAVMTAAAAAGWDLEAVDERPMSHRTIEALPGYEGQDTVPRYLGVRWRRSVRRR